MLRDIAVKSREDVCYLLDDPGSLYRVLFIIKLRIIPQDIDTIRVYDCSGQPDMPDGLRASYGAAQWEIFDFKNGESFFVLYTLEVYENSVPTKPLSRQSALARSKLAQVVRACAQRNRAGADA